MEQSSETAFQQQIDEFTRRIEALQQQHQQIAEAICLTRMARDVGLLHKHPEPRLSGFYRLGQWLTAHRNRVVPVTPAPDDRSSVIVIDAATGTVVEDQEAGNG